MKQIVLLILSSILLFSCIEPEGEVKDLGEIDSKINSNIPEEIPGSELAPVLTSVVRDGENYILSFVHTEDSITPTGGYNTLVNNQEQNDNIEHSGYIRTIQGLNNSELQCFKLKARYTQLNPIKYLTSNEICSCCCQWRRRS